MLGGMPKIPSGGKGGSGGGELDAALAEVDELQAKLAESKSRIYDALQVPLPVVEIRLPKLDLGAFGPAPAPASRPARAEYEPLAQNGASAPSAALPAIAPSAAGEAGSGSAGAASRRGKAEAARAEAERARQEMEEHARAAAKGNDAPRRLALCLAASATSVAVSLGLGAMQLGATAGPVISAVASCVICMAGLAHTWKAKSDAIFDGLLNKVFGKLTDAVLKVLDTIDDVLQGPLDKVDGLIDGMIEEQKPTLAKMQQFEDAIRKLDPDFDIPDPQDLKKPLDGCEAMIDDIMETAKREAPERLEEAVRSTLVGWLATSRTAFQGLVVCAPLTLVFLLNLAVALGQVALAGSLGAGAPGGPATEELVSPRRLRGSAGSTGREEALAAEAQCQLMACVQPALVQAALSILQTLAAMLLAQMPRICGIANRQIEALEADLNSRLNKRVEGAVDSVFSQAFGEVKGKADEFFPRFTDSVQKLRGSMEQAAKLQAAAGVAKKFGF